MSNEDQPPAQPSVPPVPRPLPQYGEYADPAAPPPIPTPAPAPAYPGYAETAPQYGAFPDSPVKKSRTWDLILTIVLLVVGFFGMLIGVFYGLALSDPAVLQEAMVAQGYEWNGEVGSISAVLIVSHLLLYVAAVAISIPLLLKKRVAFWVPLAAGVIAAFIFWGGLVAVVMSDPNFVENINRVS